MRLRRRINVEHVFSKRDPCVRAKNANGRDNKTKKQTYYITSTVCGFARTYLPTLEFDRLFRIQFRADPNQFISPRQIIIICHPERLCG